MLYKQLSILLLLSLTVFLNKGASHPAVVRSDVIHLLDGGIYAWETAVDESQGHSEIFSKARATKSLMPLPPYGKSLYLYASANVKADEYVVWERKDADGLLLPRVVFPRGTYYLHTRIDKKDEKGRFRGLRYGLENTIIPLSYAGEIDKSASVYYSEIVHSVNLGDYVAYGIGNVVNTEPDPRRSAGASASR